MAAEQEATINSKRPLAPTEPLVARFFRFVRALVVGSGATLVDFSVLTSCIRLAGLAPASARVPALLAGASVQFFGNRTYTFRARAGRIGRQAKLFICAEAITLVLNYSVFRFLAARVHFVPPELVSFAGTFVVFVTFAYPVRKLVIFKVPSEARAGAPLSTENPPDPSSRGPRERYPFDR
jgi:putative flippase GtrA